MRTQAISVLSSLLLLVGFTTPAVALVGRASAQGTGAPPSPEELAKKLANPIASLTSVPFQSNSDFGSGPDGDGFRYTLNVQPVIPFELNEDWNLITRMIVPVIYQNDEVSAIIADEEFGLGDTVQSFFFSPRAPLKTPAGDVTWGVGPVVYYPTATADELGADQWGLGPTGIVLAVKGPWTYGLLANHIWTIAETRDYESFFIDRPQINATFLQPFVTYNVPDSGGGSIAAQAEATYDWEGKQWTIPLSVSASKVLNIGRQAMSVSAGPRYYVERPVDGAEWGLRLTVTLIFPK